MRIITKSDDEWKKALTPEQYRVLREKGTEAPFSGAYVHTRENGMYLCAACGNELFSSETKYDSGSGWPSFWAPVNPASVAMQEDRGHGMERTEVACSRCGSHLGHLFDDGPTSPPRGFEGQGPKPTGKRFCVNSIALRLEKE